MLPPGEHPATWQEILVLCGGTPHRELLLTGLLDASLALAHAGCSRMWLDGSFATTSPTPNDYDACWDPIGVDPALLDPVLLDFTVLGRSRAKAKYRGDLFPNILELGSGLAFVEFFQRTRDGDAKGVVQFNPQEIP